jgi:hypothetical protein
LDAPDILVRSLCKAVETGNSGPWQYHSRSDRHSKIACWGVFFDLMRESSLLRKHIEDCKVTFGVNHEFFDYVNNKPKTLDLVISRPGTPDGKRYREFGDLIQKYGIELGRDQQLSLASLPVALEGPVGPVLVALEAKACMTAHSKSLPRFYDELNSAHQTIHASTSSALAVGFAMVNYATKFVSYDRNKKRSKGEPLEWSMHKQPKDALAAIGRAKQLPRRSSSAGHGYDGLGIVVVDMDNVSGTCSLVTGDPAPPPGDIFNYESMIHRVVNEYEVAFRGI